MKNIVDTVFDLIIEQGEVSISEIKKNLKHLKNEISSDEIDASIYSDLLNDGRFIFVENKWKLKETYTMKEIVKEHYKALGNLESLDTGDDIDDDDDTDNVVVSDETEELDLNVIDDLDDIDSFSVDDDED